jgi:lysophospholipase L1-like esterase
MGIHEEMEEVFSDSDRLLLHCLGRSDFYDPLVSPGPIHLFQALVTGKKDILFGATAVLGLSVLTFLLGEAALRGISDHKLMYPIEMAKYAKTLMMADPKNEITHVHRPNASARLMGAEISLNSLGNRGPELAAEKAQHMLRVYVLGSSVTMGWGIPLAGVFTSLVQDHLNRAKPLGPYTFEFANAGIANYNTFAQHQLFLRQFARVKPDLVVLHYFISDVIPRAAGHNSRLLEHSYLATFLYGRLSGLAAPFMHSKDLYTTYREYYEDGNVDWKNTQADIADIRDRCAQAGIPFLIMIIPDFHNLSAQSPYAELYGRMDKTFSAMGIPTLNTFVEFQKRYGDRESDLWIDPEDPHPNAKGHALMADILYDYLISRHPIKTENK